MPPFELFGTAHLASLGLTVAAFALPAWFVRRTESEAVRRRFDWLVLMMSFAGVAVRNIERSAGGTWTLQYDLPMQLCDWAYIVLWLALLTRRQLLYELGYFWGLAGTLQAMITPDLDVGFPSWKFAHFFLLHGGIVAALLYLTVAYQMQPRRGSVLRIFLYSQAYPAVALPLNWALDANYGYLMHKPTAGSLLDVLGPWPWYILSLQALGLFSFAIYYVPFWILRLRQER